LRPPEIVQASKRTIPIGSIHTTLNRLYDKGYVDYIEYEYSTQPVWGITTVGKKMLKDTGKTLTK